MLRIDLLIYKYELTNFAELVSARADMINFY